MDFFILVKFQTLRCIKVQIDHETQAGDLGKHEEERKATFLRSHSVAAEASWKLQPNCASVSAKKRPGGSAQQ